MIAILKLSMKRERRLSEFEAALHLVKNDCDRSASILSSQPNLV